MFLGLPAILWGGWLFFFLVGFFLIAAAWEYAWIFRSIGYDVSPWLIGVASFGLYAARSFLGESAEDWLTFLALAFLTYYLFRYEKGAPKSALDYTISMAGAIYLGWVGAYLYLIRALPNGGWWIMLVLPIVWLADSGAYNIGVQLGKHHFSPRLSPGKTWEGFVAGLFTAILAGAFLAWAYSSFGPLKITVWQGAGLGLLLGLLTPLGDLGESLFKRHAGVKDSGQLLPGHGGAFDRIDSWLWAGVIGYFYIQYFLL